MVTKLTWKTERASRRPCARVTCGVCERCETAAAERIASRARLDGTTGVLSRADAEEWARTGVLPGGAL